VLSLLLPKVADGPRDDELIEGPIEAWRQFGDRRPVLVGERQIIFAVEDRPENPGAAGFV
jgi:hypothetical protein